MVTTVTMTADNNNGYDGDHDHNGPTAVVIGGQ
jgi:hypothetical protein